MAEYKILRILTRLNIGGPAIHAALLTTKLNPRRFATCLVVGAPDSTEGDLSGLIDAGSARLIRLNSLRRPIRPWSDLVTFQRLLRIVREERPQVIHTHMAKAGALGRLAGWWYNTLGPGRAARARAILIHTFHGHILEGYFSPWLARLFLAIERWLARRTDCLIAVSQTTRDELLGKGIGRPEQWQVIPLGLDLSRLARLPLPNGTSVVRIGIVGRLVPIKNLNLFLEALHQLMQQGLRRSIAAVVIGDGPLREPLEREAQRLGLEPLIRFTGWQRDLRSVYEGLEVACLTSWNEGTPVSLIEAMAAGRAVVATRVGGVPDLLESDPQATNPIARGSFRVTERGVLVQPGDTEGLAKAMATVAEDAPLRLRLGEAARAYVVERFDQERLIGDMTALYERVVTGSRR